MHAQGIFLAEIMDYGFSTAKTGTTQLWVKFNTEVNEEITGFFPLSEKATQYTVEKVRAMGYTGADFADLANGELLRGNQVKIKIEHADWNGSITAKVSAVYDPDSTGGMDHDETAATNARRFNSLLRSTATKPTPQPAQKPKPRPVPQRQPVTADDDFDPAPMDDDIPF